MSRGEVTHSCTATVVAPNMIITARHCVSPYVDGEFTCTSEGTISSSSPQIPSNAGVIGSAYAPEDIEMYVGTSPYGAQATAIGEKVYVVATDSICRNDIALVRLDREVTVPPVAMRLTTPTYPGEEVMVIGYGQKDIDYIGRVERHDVPILAVGESTLYPEGKNSLPRTFAVGPAVCPGDSGGPSIADSGAVLGVFSLIRGNCMASNVRNLYTQLAAFRGFIEDAFTDSGIEPVYETEPADTSAGNAGGSSGAPGEGGAGASSGSDTATNGSGGSASAGSGGKGGTDGTGGAPSSDSSTDAAGAAGTDGDGFIRGTRKPKDGCGCRTAGNQSSEPGALGALLLSGLMFVRRRGARSKNRPAFR